MPKLSTFLARSCFFLCKSTVEPSLKYLDCSIVKYGRSVSVFFFYERKSLLSMPVVSSYGIASRTQVDRFELISFERPTFLIERFITE
jgi:hypothetical protein